MRLSRLALLLVILTALSPAALAFTFGPNLNFAETRDGTVAWTTNTTIETNSLVVNDVYVRIGSHKFDVDPDPEASVRVYINQWSLDVRKVVVVTTAGTRTGLNVTYGNPGFNLTVYQNGVATHTCAENINPCSWVFANSTKFNFTILTPTGVQQLGTGEAPAPPPASAGGGGGGDGATGNGGFFDPLEKIPNPVELFPRFSAIRWFGMALCFILLFNGIPRTRPFLPGWLQIRGNPAALLFAGSAGLALVYLVPT